MQETLLYPKNAVVQKRSIPKYCHYGKLFSPNCITLCVIYFMRHYFATLLKWKGEKIIFRLMYSKRANKLTLLKFIKIYAYLFILASKTSRVCFHPEATYAFNLYLGHIFDINLHFTLQIQIVNLYQSFIWYVILFQMINLH